MIRNSGGSSICMTILHVDPRCRTKRNPSASRMRHISRGLRTGGFGTSYAATVILCVPTNQPHAAATSRSAAARRRRPRSRRRPASRRRGRFRRARAGRSRRRSLGYGRRRHRPACSTAGSSQGCLYPPGSRASGALMMLRASRRSATRRAIGPWQLVIWITIGSGHGPSRHRWRRARATAVATRRSAHLRGDAQRAAEVVAEAERRHAGRQRDGLTAGGAARRAGRIPWVAGVAAVPLSVCQRNAKSGRFVRAKGMAPASRSRATIGASVEAICPARAATPQVVAEPATSMFSLTVNGTPASGPSGPPAATARSTAAAAARASSASVTVTALRSGLTSSMRARYDVNHLQPTWPSLKDRSGQFSGSP